MQVGLAVSYSECSQECAAAENKLKAPVEPAHLSKSQPRRLCLCKLPGTLLQPFVGLGDLLPSTTVFSLTGSAWKCLSGLHHCQNPNIRSPVNLAMVREASC